MNYTLIRLHFEGALHLSNTRLDYASSETVLHSDTVYSAIAQSWHVLGLKHLLQKDEIWKDFTLSSFFPFTSALDKEGKPTEKKVYFFPKPFARLTETIQANRKIDGKKYEKPSAKELKKISFYGQDYFQKFLTQTAIASYGDFNEHLQGDYLCETRIDEKFMCKEISSHNRTPRQAGQDAEPFQIERVYFKQGSGLYGIIAHETEAIPENVRHALDLLAHEGLGSYRHLGLGQFTYDVVPHAWKELDLSFPESNYAVNLSLYSPESKEAFVADFPLEDKKVGYALVKRGGWITTEGLHTYHKKPVLMLGEGGIIRMENAVNQVFEKGKSLIDITPDIELKPLLPPNSVLRNGKSIFVPVKL